jgi:death-on-curing protein
LESALARVRNRFVYGASDLFELAAAYAFGTAKDHPLNDGNKRTALVASFTFLRINGYDLSTSQIDNASVFMKLAAGEVSEQRLASWFRNNAVRREQ